MPDPSSEEAKKALLALKQEYDNQALLKRVNESLMRAKLEDERLAAIGAEIEIDSQGRRISARQALMEHGKRLSTISAQATYVGFETSVGEMGKGAALLCQTFYYFPFAATVLGEEYRAAWHQLKEVVKEKLSSFLGVKKQEYSIHYGVEVNDKGVLTTAFYKDADPIEDKNAEYAYTIGVVSWLKEQGFDYDYQTRVVSHSDTGKPISEEEFSDLLHYSDNEDKLETYFANNYQLNIKSVHSIFNPSPRF